ncbi:complex I NDUFA9 subunit family protein [Celeribacter indicus]|uniref:NAD-dependent epimerase/dehydratase n=1 Tax=Celeribacter indicus TaxID=1208324 RepID=A0A0B5DXM4_9RHOB|nr:complex I NDUFA9 subunit family protein [Celeribacter indicus]AJE45002.1 NAD-dependent epimerase/dehydratase [Celeribacter indicus]SDW95062.1 NADH dehydrogenase [Celeribacter indicus]
MTKLVTIYGGAGFVGRYIARRMAKEGWRVRVAVRRPNESLFVKPYGAVGQVEPVFCNIRDDASVRAAMAGADAVVNCVGVLTERGKNTFQALQSEGAGRVARIAAEEGVGQFVHISALGADRQSASAYARTKAEGEEAVLAAYPGAVILRPSLIFGTEDRFFNRFAKMARNGPILGLVGGETKFQPVYVDDVAQAAVKGVLGEAPAGIYELGGPDVDTLSGLMRDMLGMIHRNRFIVNLPFWMGNLIGGGLSLLQLITGGLFHNKVLTRDQVANLKADNVVSPDAKTFADLGIRPTAMEAVLPDYLWVYRPSGQYDAIRESAKNMRKI